MLIADAQDNNFYHFYFACPIFEIMLIDNIDQPN